MFNLFILILERVGLIIILAYLLMNTHYFRDKLGERQRLSTKVALIVVFGILPSSRTTQALKSARTESYPTRC